MTSTGSASPARHVGRWLVGVLALLLLGTAAFFIWQRMTPPSPELPVSAPLPPLTTSPFLNTKPGVAYVGDQACAGCHRPHTKAYRQHPMGRSLFHAADAPPLEKYDAGNPFQAGRFHFQALRQGQKVIHKEWVQDAGGNVVAEVRAEMAYAIGSGTQARSYFVERDGFLFQSPITWFSDKSGWGLSPGYDKHLVHFHRRIQSGCVYCHTQEAHPLADSVNRYKEPAFGQLAIGCERCHGPGELHVAGRKKGLTEEGIDHTIVNPRHLASAFREAVCEQCHIQGEAIVVRRGRSQWDYRPGLPLHEYITIFVRPPEVEDPSRIVGHVEQMHQSACFTKSGGKFGCISCHDPHAVPTPEAKVAFYQDRCRACHGAPKRTPVVQAPDCSMPLAERMAKDARDNCLTCHMPRNPSATSHLAVTDHRVLRHVNRPRKPMASGFREGSIPLLAFHRNLLKVDEDEASRDLALATIPLAEQARREGAGPIGDVLLGKARPLLDKAIARDLHDIPVLEALGGALVDQEKFADALAVLERALAQAPDREQALTSAAEAAFALGRLESAETYSRRLTEKYPHYPMHHERLAFILVERKAWPQAVEAAQKAVSGDPFRAEARELLITALLETGARVRARNEFEILGVVDPNHQKKLRPRLEAKLGK